MSAEVLSQGYGAFSYAVHEKVFAHRIPVNGTIEVTRRCPLKCSHCYNNLPVGDANARREELSYDELCRVMDEMAEAGCLWLLLTGGEIFARKDFLDIYTYAKKKGFLVTLFTNGTLITEEIADYLREWRPFAIEITLYGRTRETYEKLTGVPGSFDRCMRGIKLLLERGLPLSLKTMAVTVNQHEVWDMKRYAEEELGVEFKFDAMISPRIDCSQSPLGVRLSPEQVVSFDLEDPNRFAEWTRMARDYIGKMKVTNDVYHCGGGVSAFAINPSGKMSICVLSQEDTYDLRQGSFREGWDLFLKKVRTRKATRLTKCTGCQIKTLCSMCAANGELERGDAESPVDFLCEVAHLRTQVVGYTPPAHGDCEYCAGGARFPALMRSVEALKNGETVRAAAAALEASASRVSLPVLAQAAGKAASACGSGGCSSCGSQ